jgi:rhodanese-related sulfurtransferase
VTALSSNPTTTQTISPTQLFELHKGGKPVEVIDVRTPAEYRAVHASIARPVPLDSLDPKAVIAARQLPDEPLYVICKSGERGKRACAAFAAAGYGDTVVNVEGGTQGWSAAGLPVVKGQFMLPLDGQVQTVAGLMVLLGCGLGAFVSPWCYLLAAFSGLGLVVAGVTGICPMASLIARMPWNQVNLDQPSTCNR